MEKLKINYDHTYSSKYTRDYYRGKSFHYAGRWEIGKRYVSDEYNTDFVVHDSLLLVCKKNHTASAANEPTEFYEMSDGLIGLNSPYWDIVMPVLYGDSKYVVIGIEQERGTSRDHAMSQNAVTLELVALEEAIAANREQINADLQLLRTTVTRTAEELRSRAEVIENDIATKWSEFLQTADEISTTVAANKSETDAALSNLQTNITQTAEAIRSEASAMREDLEGNIHELSSSITQTASEIRSEVNEAVTELNGTIETNNSTITQRADQIEATVTANRQAAEDALNSVNEELSSRITQNAESISTEVSNRLTREDEIVADYDSKFEQTAQSISTEVSAREAAIEGVQTDYNSKFQQTAQDIQTEISARETSEVGIVEDYTSKISQTATEINSTVTALTNRVSTAESNITQNANAITAEVERLNNFETSVGNTFATHQELLNSLQTQVDGAIVTYFAEGAPTLQNYPANEWDTDEIKETHVGDIYYDKNTGYSYRFLKENNTYVWYRILDSDITTAIANAAAAQETADGKMTIFYTQPSTYCKGDLWIYEENGEVLIKRSEHDRTNNYVSTDWVLVSDVANATKVRAAFEILADMIRSEVGEYTSNNDLVPGSLYSYITQSRNQISAKIATAKGEAITTSDNNTDGKLSTLNGNLLDTGIDITNKKIELTADNIVLKNNSGQRGLELVTGSDGKPLIDVTNLNVGGIFTTDAWETTSDNLLTTAQNYANTAESNAKTAAASDATSKANAAKNDAIAAAKAYSNSADYLASIKPTINSGMATSNDLAGYEYLKTALTKGSTAIGGGLVLSSLIQLGGPTNNWQVWSGLNGVRNSDTDIAFWAGGEMSETGNRAAKSVIRMDGSGYLANKNITWDNTGNASFTGNITAKSITFAEGVKIDADYINGLSTDDITGLDNLAYVKSVKVGSTAYNPSNGVVSLPAYPTTLPASDVYSWAKAFTKPSYSYSEISGTPTIPTKVSELTNDAGYITTATAVGSLITNATTGQTVSSGESMSGNITLHKISKTGSYNDLLNKPTIPTNTSQLTNDSGFLTSHQSLSGYATESWVTNRGYITGITKDMVTRALGYTPPTSDTNTWRPVYCNTTSIGSNTLTLKAGNNVSLTHSSGTITIDTTSNLSAYMLTADYIEAGKIKANLIDVDNLIAKKVDVRTGTDESTRIAYIGDTSWPIYAGGTSASSAVFKVDYAGNMTATSGVIGPMVLSNSGIAYDGSYKTGLGDWGDAVRLFAGASSFSPNAIGTAPFRVYDNGTVYASNFNVSGGSIDGNLRITQNGSIGVSGTASAIYIDGKSFNVGSSAASAHMNSAGISVQTGLSTPNTSSLNGARLLFNYANDSVSIGMDGIYKSTSGTINSYAVWGDSAYKIKVVSTMPSTQDSNTLYFVTS